MTWTPHHCPECGQRCKSPPGSGAQAALKWRIIRPVNQKILLVLVNHAAESALDMDRIRHYAALECELRTSANAFHNRLSELVAWKLVHSTELPNSARKQGTDYDNKSQNVAMYRANLTRANIVMCSDWKTENLRALDREATGIA